jgi:hypothetical protein
LARGRRIDLQSPPLQKREMKNHHCRRISSCPLSVEAAESTDGPTFAQ